MYEKNCRGTACRAPTIFARKCCSEKLDQMVSIFAAILEPRIMKSTKPNLTELSWEEAILYIEKVNFPLAEAIKKLNPSKDFTLIKATYSWGQHLLQEGVLNVPNEKGKLVSIYDSSINPKIRKKLNYNETIPMGLVLNHSVELYINANQRKIPFVSMSKGKIFALWIALQENITSSYSGHVDNIVAGTCSLMMLPKISDISSYKKIKKQFGLKMSMPKGFNEQGNLFTELANHPDFPTPWSMDVLYFTDKWLDNKTEDKWRLFRTFLLETGWASTNNLRNQIVFDLTFSCALEAGNLKPNPFLADTVKHLYAIGQGVYPGFKIAADDDVAPISGFQQIFAEIYGLKYAPILVHPSYLSSESEQPIYYSLEVPTLMTFSPKSRKANNKLEDLREIKHVMDSLLKYINLDVLRLKKSPLYKLAQDVEFTYYHSDIDHYGETLLTEQLVNTDSSLKNQLQNYIEKPFCETSSFLRGCVGITKRK